MPSILEPIAAGIFVALFNKYIINHHFTFSTCTETTHETTHEDDSSTTTTINSDVGQIHLHY